MATMTMHMASMVLRTTRRRRRRRRRSSSHRRRRSRRHRCRRRSRRRLPLKRFQAVLLPELAAVGSRATVVAADDHADWDSS